MVRQIVSYWGRTLRRAAVDRESDEQLLHRFATCRDEIAFEALVRRHGPMVWGVCQRLLFHHQDAEDAFQAAFLVLAKKAGRVGRAGRLANWLFGVAQRTAWNLRRRRDGQARREQATGMLQHHLADTPAPGSDVTEIVDEELARLPEHFRLPIVLCCLQGKTHAQAAEHLSWPTGTVAGRLSRGRALLRERLQRRGVEVAAVSFGLALTADPLRSASVAAVARWAVAFAGADAASAVPAAVRAVAEATIRELSPVRSALIWSGIGCIGLGLFGLAASAAREPATAPARPPAEAVALRVEPAPIEGFIALPADPATVVVRLETVDTTQGQVRERLTVQADGQMEALAAPPDAAAVTVKSRLTATELQGLLRYIVHAQEFLAFNAGTVDRELRQNYFYDGKLNVANDPLTTRIRLRTADRENEIAWHQLGSATVFFPDAKRLNQFHQVERRLHNLLLVQVAGGPATVASLADWTTRRLRQTYPTLAPLSVADLCGQDPEADGSGVRVTFSRGDKFEGADFFSVTVLVPAEGAPKLLQTIPRPSFRRPTPIARRLCDDILAEMEP